METDGSDAIVESTPECLRAILGNTSHTALVAGIGKAAAAAGQGKAKGLPLPWARTYAGRGQKEPPWGLGLAHQGCVQSIAGRSASRAEGTMA